MGVCAARDVVEAQVTPVDLLLALGRALDAESRVLVRHDVVLVLGVERLEVLRDQDVVVGQLVRGLREVLEEVGVVRRMEVEVGCVGVARLCLSAAVRGAQAGGPTMADGRGVSGGLCL
jgi:hypothetical protein